MTRRGKDEYVITLYRERRGERAKTNRGSNENLINGACNDEADARDNKSSEIKLKRFMAHVIFM